MIIYIICLLNIHYKHDVLLLLMGSPLAVFFSREREEVKQIMENELHFLETCLKVNPKSYGTWHHRSFILENIPNPDWARELELCNKFLEYDERNCKFNICVWDFFFILWKLNYSTNGVSV